MSRTTRKTFYDNQPSLRVSRIEEWTGYRGKTTSRDRYLNGYDGVRGTFGEPCSKSPNGYDRWNDREGASKWAKRGASKVMRNRFKRAIREEVRLLDAADDEIVTRRLTHKKTPYKIRRLNYSRKWCSDITHCTATKTDFKNIFQRLSLENRIKMWVKQREDICKIRVHKSLYASLQEEIRELDEQINCARIKIRSLR